MNGENMKLGKLTAFALIFTLLPFLVTASFIVWGVSQPGNWGILVLGAIVLAATFPLCGAVSLVLCLLSLKRGSNKILSSVLLAISILYLLIALLLAFSLLSRSLLI